MGYVGTLGAHRGRGGRGRGGRARAEGARTDRRGDGKPKLAFGLAAALLVGACVLSRLDLTFYVSLYARLHTLLELAACVLAAVAFLRVRAGGSVGRKARVSPGS